MHAINEGTARIKRYDALLTELVPQTEQAQLIQALQAFRGIKLLTAASIAFELGDVKRFGTAKKLMSYVGLTPSEASSGDRVRRGGITKAGNQGLRRLMVESAWSYRHTLKESYLLKKRAEGVAPGVRKIAFDAQVRLHGRYKRLLGRGKNKQITLTAIARELLGFIWAAAHEQVLVS